MHATVVMWLELCLGCTSHLIVVYMQYNEEFFTHTRERERERERERRSAMMTCVPCVVRGSL